MIYVFRSLMEAAKSVVCLRWGRVPGYLLNALAMLYFSIRCLIGLHNPYESILLGGGTRVVCFHCYKVLGDK